MGNSLPPKKVDVEINGQVQKMIRGISIEEAERRDQLLIKQIQTEEHIAKSREFFKSMVLWFLLYNSIGLTVLLLNQERSMGDLIYIIGIWITVFGSLMMFVTTMSGMAKFAVPRMMIVADPHMGVMDDIRNAKKRVYSTLSGPFQGIFYGIILILFGVSLDAT